MLCFLCNSLICTLFVEDFGVVMDLPLNVASVLTLPDDTLPASAFQMDLPKEPEWKYYHSCRNISTKTFDTHCICGKLRACLFF